MSYKPLPDNLTIKESPIHGLEEYSVIEVLNLKNITSLRCIYGILINNYLYIGSTIDLKERLKRHISKLKYNKHSNKKFQNVYNKYKTDLRYFIIFQDITNNNLYVKEQEILDKILKDNNYKILNLVLDITATGSNGSSISRSIDCYDKSGNFINSFKNIRIAEKELNINKTLIRGCCRKLQKTTNNLLFFFSDDIVSINEFKNNPYKYLQSGHISKKKVKNSNCVGKKWSNETILKNKDSKKYDYHIEVYNFSDRRKLGYYTSIREVSRLYNISNYAIRKNIISETFIINDYIIRVSKIKKGILPQGYYYRPLQPGLTIEKDVFDELKIVTKFKILKGSTLGVSHIKLPTNELVRCEMGGFINTSETPNCALIETKRNDIITEYVLTTIRDIKAGEEITLNYTKELCGLTDYKDEKWLK